MHSIIQRSASLLQAAVAIAAGAVLWQNLSLRSENGDLRNRLGPVYIATGMRVRNVTAVNMNGLLTSVALPSSEYERLLVMTISPQCPICRKNQYIYTELVKRFGGRDNLRLMWISRESLEQTRQYVMGNDMPLREILAEPSQRTYRELGLEAVPQAILIKAGGSVQKSWNGILSPDFLHELAVFVPQRTSSSGIPSKALLIENIENRSY